MVCQGLDPDRSIKTSQTQELLAVATTSQSVLVPAKNPHDGSGKGDLFPVIPNLVVVLLRHVFLLARWPTAKDVF